MSNDWSLRDRTTWITILTVAGAALGNVFHTDLAPWVAPAATLAAGIVIAITTASKHHYGAVLAGLVGTAAAAGRQSPPVDAAALSRALGAAHTVLDELAAITNARHPAPAARLSPPSPPAAPNVPTSPAAAPSEPHSGSSGPAGPAATVPSVTLTGTAAPSS